MVAALVFLATFTDILAYSIAVPVLPDLSARLGASPTVIGLLFGSFGVTLLTVSIPMGAVSDRIGRRGPMLVGLAALTGSSALFAFSTDLPMLFAARLVQGAADAVTWVVGLALVADLYGPDERGRVTGVVMSGAGGSFMIGPSIGGWLYEQGGIRLPFLAVAALAAALLVAAFVILPRQPARPAGPAASVADALRRPAVIVCVLVVVAAAGSIAMLEPIVVLHLETFGVSPGRMGTLFGIAALFTAVLNPVHGRLSDRFGPAPIMLIGLVAAAAIMPFLGRTLSFREAVIAYTVTAAAIAMVVTPSLSFIANATTEAGSASFGVGYGVYNVGWGVGLLAGPAAGGYLFDRIGFRSLTLVVTVVMLLTPAMFGAYWLSPRSDPTRRP